MSPSLKSGKALQKEVESTDAGELTSDKNNATRKSTKDSGKTDDEEEIEKKLVRAAKKARKEKRRLEKASREKKDASNSIIDTSITAAESNSVSDTKDLGDKETRRKKKKSGKTSKTF